MNHKKRCSPAMIAAVGNFRMGKRNNILWISSVVVTYLFTGSALAARGNLTLTLDAYDRGWYSAGGSHDPSNTNYLVGNTTDGRFFRNFFVFDVSAIQVSIIAAELHLLSPSAASFQSGDATEMYRLSKVSTDPFELVSEGFNDVAIYNDLASEPIYGDYLASEADNQSLVIIPLTAFAVADINNTSLLWAVGGSIGTLDGNPNSEELFFVGSGGNPGGDMSQTQLVLTVIPAPGVLLPLLAGALLPVRARRRYT